MDMIKEGEHIARQEAARSIAAPHAGEYLTFRLGTEEYGVDIQKVQEIRSYEHPTRIPGAPHYVKGVVNLRGVIVPIVDLRVKLGCDEVAYNPFTVVIVMAVNNRVVGAVVDAVSDVLDLQAETIKPPPELADAQAADFVTAIASVSDRMIMLVDMVCLLGAALGSIPGQA
ncbi:chemotaxis protein CheW [Ramlibacter humi]|uniref:Chemotaxis protein CheW n=1 Tax=Ramlibacter humi TaxID=2530451 RepID=A0A4Z0CBQ4_9BURK|nr:chemotaxis protein CheW [Ramlibacter humi]TFZ08322.1 chemotaxis protein CheW [Ramlibacter humi]